MAIISISGKKQSGKNTIATIIQYLTSDRTEFSIQDVLAEDGMIFRMVVEEHSTWEQKSFAYELKLFISRITGIPMEDFEDEEKKNQFMAPEWGYWYNANVDDGKRFATDAEVIAFYLGADPCFRRPTLRDMMTMIGTDALRKHFHPNIWVNALFASYYPIIKTVEDAGKIEDWAREQGKERWSNEELASVLPERFPNWIITDVRFPNELQACKDRKAITIRVNRFPEPLIQSTHESETALDNTEFDHVIANAGTLEDLVENVKSILRKEGIIGNETKL